MAIVTVTGNAWTHRGEPIPANRKPELWFRPRRESLNGDSLLTATDVRADLNATTGAFQVKLEAGPALLYRPWMRWLTNPHERDTDKWAFGFSEWPFDINPYPIGGDLSHLVKVEPSTLTVLVSLNPPPPGFTGWWLHSGPGDPDDTAQSGTGELRRVYR